MTEQSPRFTLTMLLWLKPDGAAALKAFREQAAPLFKTHDLRVERQIMVSAKGQIVGENPFEPPHLVQVLSFPTAAQFKAYVSDPHYVALAAQRDQSLHRMCVMAGSPLDVTDIATPGQGPLGERLYGVSLPSFKPDGRAGMDRFNREGQALFMRHGMHVESILEVLQTLTPVGESQGMQADRVVVFFLDRAADLQAYAADPEYAALAPLRDAGLAHCPVFFGTAVQS